MGETEEERARRLMRAMMNVSTISESVAHWGSFHATQCETTILENHIVDSSYNKDLIKFNKFIFKFA